MYESERDCVCILCVHESEREIVCVCGWVCGWVGDCVGGWVGGCRRERERRNMTFITFICNFPLILRFAESRCTMYIHVSTVHCFVHIIT